MKLSVIIPVYNEVGTILEVIKKVKEAPFDKEIIIVDDASTDGTRSLLEKCREEVKVFFHEANQGKGAAIQTAIPHITGNVVIIQDADLEYDPSEYPRLIAPIRKEKADVVYGSRFLGGPHRGLLCWHSVGNRISQLYRIW
jgi:glycosyltransferase involved in cell wall biosynthesis